MKRIIALLLASCLMFCLFAGCSKEAPALKAGYDPRMLTLLDGGRDPHSFIGRIASLVGERIDGSVSLSPALPEEAAGLMEDGSIDFYIAVSDDVSFGEEILSSEPLFSIDTLVLSAEKPESEDLTGLNAVAVLDSSVFDAAADDEGYRSIGQITVADSAIEALSMVGQGLADVAVLDEINARAITDVSPKEFYFYERPLYSAEVRLYARKDMSMRRKVLSSVSWMLKNDRLANASFETLGADVTL